MRYRCNEFMYDFMSKDNYIVPVVGISLGDI